MDINRTLNSEELNAVLGSGQEWVEKFLNSCASITREGALSWCQLVLRMGGKDDVRQEWMTIFENQLKSNMTELIEDTDQLHQKMISTIENLMKQLQEYCIELDVKMPYLDGMHRTLYDEQQELSKLVSEFEVQVKKKQTEIMEMTKKQKELCYYLDKEPLIIPDKPRHQDLENIRKNIESLELTLFERREIFENLRTEILELVEELKIKKQSDYEDSLLKSLSNESSNFIFSDTNMDNLEKYHSKLVKHSKDIKEKITNAWAKLTDIWDMLQKDVGERDAFSKKINGYSFETLDTLLEEINCCEIIKKENIKTFVEQFRKKLLILWEQCHCSNAQRSRFVCFDSDIYNEDVLELHEREIESWKQYYRDHKEIITAVEEFNELWARHLDLEKNVEGLNRYKNRGGQLLKEEKERNRITKKIPLLRDKIIALSEQYYETRQKHFLTFGKTVVEHFDDLLNQFEEDKKKRCGSKKERAVTPAKSFTKLYQSTSATNLLKTPTKRKLVTPRSENKKPKCTEPTKTTNSIKKNVVLSAIKIGPINRRSIERRKRLKLCTKRLSRSKHDTSQAQLSPPDYDDFEHNLSNKENCRSTISENEVQAAFNRHRSPSTPRTHLKLKAAPKSSIKLTF